VAPGAFSIFFFCFDQVVNHLDAPTAGGGLAYRDRLNSFQSDRSTPNVADFATMDLRTHHWAVGCLVPAVACLSPGPP
jgi:hypothetical protein